MTTPTPETLIRHELTGLTARVVESANPDSVGIGGRVVRETMQTLTLAEGDRVWQIPKRGTTFEFDLTERTDEAADAEKASGTASERPSETAGDGQSDGCEGVAHVTVDGARLLSRPALRTEKAGVPTWR
jgi:ribonuclease P protein subunit POP4